MLIHFLDIQIDPYGSDRSGVKAPKKVVTKTAAAAGWMDLLTLNKDITLKCNGHVFARWVTQ